MKEFKESEAMLELRRIREKQYEEIKDMTPAEIISYYKMRTEEFEKKSGVNLKRCTKEPA